MKTGLALLFGMAAAALAENASRPVSEPVLEPPTLQCLGAYWVIAGDGNTNAAVGVEYRKAGDAPWQRGYPLFRVEKGAQAGGGQRGTVDVPDNAWLFAGSVVTLTPDTGYELKLTLKDPDGGSVERLLTARTMAEPAVPREAPVRHVFPGNGGGTGTRKDPFKGLPSAEASARPGDIFLLHPGVYEGTFSVGKSGAPGKPIVWRGSKEGAAIIDAQGKAAVRPGRAISASGVRDVWFERLVIRNADWGIVAHEGTDIVVRQCRIEGCDYGLTCTRNDTGRVRGFFIADNVIEGPCAWPRTKGIENPRGIQITGAGHVVCHNRVRGFADAIDTFPSPWCAAIDFHDNDISECTDDGIEMDYSRRNTRCFNNRFSNVFQGISVQPVYGGPVYVFRNVLYNVVAETFKMHNNPSGALFFHNTSVKQGMPLILNTSDRVHNSVLRNNLFVGTAASYAYENNATMENCDFDYDGFGGGPWKMFLKWNGVRYASLDEARARAPVYRHAVLVDPATAFASGIQPPADPNRRYDPAANDLRLKPGSAAIDKGQVLPGFNDHFSGPAPDLGACETGSPLPLYGPRSN